MWSLFVDFQKHTNLFLLHLTRSATATHAIYIMQQEYVLQLIANGRAYKHKGNLCEPILFLLL